jgi:hypothetical protein
MLLIPGGKEDKSQMIRSLPTLLEKGEGDIPHSWRGLRKLDKISPVMPAFLHDMK